MNIKQIAKQEFDKSGIENDSIFHAIWEVAFELGYKYGQERPPVGIAMISRFTLELESNQALKEIICMQHRMDQKIYEKLMADFIVEQTALNRTYKDLADVQNHFRNWVRKKVQDNPNILRSQNSPNGGQL
jgi:hypothetical protein